MDIRRYAAMAAPIIATMAATPQNATDQRPDIILFMVDDMGWQDTSVPFADSLTHYNRMFRTPNMERLAAQGVKFTQAYACAISSPSRCSLFTGANAARHGVTNWTLSRGKTTDGDHPSVDIAPWNVNGVQCVEGVENSFVGNSFVEMLRRSGYHTIHCGKAHLGALDTPGENPIHWGFEVNIGGHAGGGLATYLSERNYGHDSEGNPTSAFAIPGLEHYWGSGIFATEALTREALKALDKAAKYPQPYFLYMSHYAVHIPIDRDERFYDSYIAEGVAPKDAAYASLVEGMDKSLGDILDWIERNGRADRTIVIFMSDNGGLAAQPQWRDGKVGTQNSPLRSGKGSLYEGGIREPMIVKMPDGAGAATTDNSPLMIDDFFPSILAMAGVDYDPVSLRHPLDGVDFTPLLRGESMPQLEEREIIWNYPNVWGCEGDGIDLNCAIRKGPWKLIYNYADGSKELYNIADDLSETHNAAKENPDVVEHLSTRLGRLLRERGAMRPTFKSTGSPCAWPDEI